MTDEDSFKRLVTQQTGVDVESSRIRWLIPGDSRDRAWRYARFSEDAAQYMTDRLRERYFPDGEWADAGTADEETAESDDTQREVFGAIPIANAAESLTGYATVTVEVVATERFGEEQNGVKAIAKDTSGAIDIVAWDEPLTTPLEETDGECIVLKNIEVTEYEGNRQLSPVDGLTEIESIQAGVGHTEGPARDDGQAGLDGARAQADGGLTDIEGMQGRVLEHLRNRGTPKDIVTTAEIAGSMNESADDVDSALDALAEKGRVIRHDGGGVSLD